MCVGKNYAAHAIEMGSAKDIPDHPLIFTKAHTTICAHQDDVSLHSDVTEQVDYEGELAIVIGKKRYEDRARRRLGLHFWIYIIK
ncbi:fumarylacetoacetate hydrolase family protein [Geomicrobium sp. JCM 19055]|nr:fumarylacetoacetate hydrolase family protein [Geomicrobium sp. JCM 19055]